MKLRVSTREYSFPDGFDFEVEHDPNHPTEVAANGDGVACGFLVWTLPSDPPPMIAVVTCDFRVHANGETLVTEPVTLVLQSQEGLMDGRRQSISGRAGEEGAGGARSAAGEEVGGV